MITNRLNQLLLLCLLLGVATLAAYWQPGDHEFITYDDHEYVTENEVVQAGLTQEGFTWAFTTGHTGNWHPLTWLSIMVDCDLYGLNRTGHYYTNVTLHILSTIILFLALYRMSAGLWQSAFVAALFALHPIHVESVAWAAERKDVLSGFFWMITMWAYAFYVERPRFVRYVWVLLAFALGLMAKPMLVTLPFALLLLDYWPLNRVQLGEMSSAPKKGKGQGRPYLREVKLKPLRLIREKVPLFIIVVASSLITLYVQQRAEASWETLPLSGRLANAAVAYAAYIGKMLWPSSLAVFYPHPLGSLPLAAVAGATVLVLGVSAFAVWARRKYPYLSVGWFWYVGTLVPVIGLVQVGAQSMADRYSYIPLVGLFIIIAWGATELITRRKSQGRLIATLAGVVVLVFIVLTRQQVGFWKNSITLFDHAIEVTTDNYVAHSSIAVGLARVGRIPEAIKHVTEGLRIKPDNAEAENNLGGLLARQGKIDEAIEHYRDAVRIRPDYATARFNLGFYLSEKRNIPEAIVHYNEALQIRPDYADARLNLGNILVAQGKMPEAMAQYSELVQRNPYYDKGLYVMGFYRASEGKFDEAIGYYRKALQINPNYAEVHYYLGVALEARGRTQEAIPHYSAALQINPNYTSARVALENARSRQK